MKTILFAFFGVFVVLCFTSCAQQPMAQTSQPAKCDLVQVAVITTEVGSQAKQVLQRAGVQCIIEAGSGEYAYFSGVWLSKSVKHQAISLLRTDPVIDKSMLFDFP